MRGSWERGRKKQREVESKKGKEGRAAEKEV